MAFIVCVNQPGYLPEQEPTTCESLGDARTILIAELHRTAEAGTNDDDREAAVVEATRIPSTGGVIELGGYAHEITPANE